MLRKTITTTTTTFDIPDFGNPSQVVVVQKPSTMNVITTNEVGAEHPPEVYPDTKYLHDNSNPNADVSTVSDHIQTNRIDEGVFDPLKKYHKNSMVLYGRHKYVCITNTVTGVVPSVTPNWRKSWTILNVLQNDGIDYFSKGIGHDRIGSIFHLQAHDYEIN